LTSFDHHSPAALLHFYALCGVDEAVGDDPQIWFDRAPPPPAVKIPHQPLAKTPVVAPPPAENDLAAAMVRSREIARQCQNLDQLQQAMTHFKELAIRETATQLVFADGVAGSRLMLIGAAPGDDEDQQGKAFVGASGQLLDRMLAAIGHDRTNCYISYIVPWRPPANRKPTQDEIAICQPFIERHIELAKPAVILLLGDTAAQTLLKTTESILRSRGRWHDYISAFDQLSVPMIASFHPDFLLRNPTVKRDSWRDLLQVQTFLTSETT